MKVPVACSINKDNMRIYHNGTVVNTKFPVELFALYEKKLHPNVKGPSELLTKLPNNELVEYVRHRFNSVAQFQDFRKQDDMKADGIYIPSAMDQVYIQDPEFFLKYSHDKPLTIFYWDIEVGTKGDGFFPTYLTSDIICIGYALEQINSDYTCERKQLGIISNYDWNAKKLNENTTKGDHDILVDFIKIIQELDPDVISGFMVDEFDMPYVMGRCSLLGISPTIGRSKSKAFLGDKFVSIPGRANFDIYNAAIGVRKDQTLFGMKHRGLKPLSEHYGVTGITNTKPENMNDMLNAFKNENERVIEYLKDDVVRTEFVGNIYIRNAIALAEVMKVPLATITAMQSSFIPKLFLARNMWKDKLVCSETNARRYNEMNGTIAKLGTETQGALVGLYKRGYFPKLQKVDFSSMYPSAIETFNISVDTVRLVEVRDYTGKYKFASDETANWYVIPDYNFKKDLVIRISKTKDGILKREIKKLKAERARIKTLAKAEQDINKKLVYRSQEVAVKVINNSVFGIMGLKSSIYGDLMCAATITGMCRYLTSRVVHHLKDNLVCLDTDGLILDKEINVEELNKFVSELVLKEFNISDNTMKLDEEKMDDGYFYAMKNYIIRNDSSFNIHGSSLKASRAAKVTDRAVQLGIEHIFNNKPIEEVVKEAYDFNGLDLTWFIERMTISKEEYHSKTGMHHLLSKQMELKTKKAGTIGTQMTFYVTKKQLPYKELIPFYGKSTKWNYVYSDFVTSVDDLNLAYYHEKITKVLARLGVEAVKQLSMFSDDDIEDTSLSKLPTF